MTDLSEDPDLGELRDYYEASDDAPTECWANYGDASPAEHGGGWVGYDNGWHHVGTFPAVDVGYPMDDLSVDDPVKAQFVYSAEVHWRDIITDDGDWTSDAQSTVDSLHNGPESPAAAVVDDMLTWFVVAYADESRTGLPRHDPVHTGSYRNIIEGVGVEPCEDGL